MTVTRKFSEEVCQSVLLAGACGVEPKGIFPDLLTPRLWVCFVCLKSGTVGKEGVRGMEPSLGAESAPFSLVSDKVDSEYGLYSCSPPVAIPFCVSLGNKQVSTDSRKYYKVNKS